MQDLLRWLNGWVYSASGPDGLLVFQSHPVVYAALALATVLAAALGLAWALVQRWRRWQRAVRLWLGLVRTPRGRRCLRLARQIRRGGARLRAIIRSEIEERAERRALLQVLQRFARSELHGVLEQGLRLIADADERRLPALQAALERDQQAWSAAADDGERARLQRASAETRQQLARIREDTRARDEHLLALEEAAQAVQLLESELTGLRWARNRALPEFRDHLTAVAGQVSHLKAAYRELNESR